MNQMVIQNLYNQMDQEGNQENMNLNLEKNWDLE
jgi:hypothetical protein